MIWWAIRLTVIYVFLKVLQVMFGPQPGFGPREFGIRQVVGAGEPALLIIAFLISLLATLYPEWHTTRLALREIGQSTVCYGQLAASGKLPKLAEVFDVSKVVNESESYKGVAVEHAAMVKIGDEKIETLLDGAKLHYEAYFADIAAKGDEKSIREAFKSIDRCLHDDWEPHGDFLNP